MDLELIRKQIDQVDQELVSLLEERMTLVEQVVAFKKSSGKSVFDSKREEAIFEKVRTLIKKDQYQESIVATFSDILKHSRHYQDKNIK
ncbi:chorismate mutase [Streptococcus mitis]|uniref:chorismate mutase n=1 Tax=Streptococcus mitis TaxID=28037 RepID=UPI001157DB96|nr:chorismate mutase [Streptococcus mitis]